jgi:hypothetical protein
MTLVAVALLLAAPVAVQNANAQLELTMGAGLNTPMADYGDQVNMGYTLNAGLGYRFMPYAAVGMEASYSGNGASDDAMAGLADGYSMSSSIMHYAVVAKLIAPAFGHNVYAKGSWGNYRGSAKVSGPVTTGSVNFTDSGYGLGGGFVINGSKSTSLIADITYHHVAFGDEGEDATTYFTFTVGALVSFDLFKHKMRDDLQDDLDKLRDN